MPNRARILAALTAVAALALTGCGSGDSGPSAHAGQAGPVTVDVTIRDGNITPAGERVNASVGQPIKLNVTSDSDDEIHVHTQPDHEFEATPGKQQTFTFTVNRPGVYEVESHNTDTLILSLAIRP